MEKLALLPLNMFWPGMPAICGNKEYCIRTIQIQKFPNSHTQGELLREMFAQIAILMTGSAHRFFPKLKDFRNSRSTYSQTSH